MNHIIAIPSFNRPNRQITFDSLPRSLQVMSVICVSSEEEKKKYADANPSARITVIRADDIAMKRHFIMNKFRKSHSVVWMLDDDMVFDARCPSTKRIFLDGQWRATGKSPLLPRATESQIFSAFRQGLSIFQENKIAMVGISSRLGNQRIKEDISENTRIMHAFAVSTEYYFSQKKFLFSDVLYREDFHVALSFLKIGFENRVLNNVMVNPGAYNSPGGCSSTRSIEKSDAQARLLAELHPGLVRIVEKQYKNQPRLEVVCQWKKARAQGVRK